MSGVPEYLRDAVSGQMLWPNSASTLAPKIDRLFYALSAATLLIMVALTLLILYFSIRYRASASADRSAPPTARQESLLEVGWTIPTLILFLGFFGWAATAFLEAFRSPAGAVPVTVVAKQWMWKIQHPNGAREINELHVPAGEKIELRMTSQDVIHSFYVPAFRVKRDVLPARYTTVWFEATEPGVYSLFCAEFCGVDHSRMRGRVVVMNPADYERWLAGQDVSGTPAAEGEKLFAAYGCTGCHDERADVHAPSLAGIYNRPVQLQGGGTTIADDAYIHDSIVLPQKHVVAGYRPIMPSFEGQVSESEILSLLAYIKSLGDATEGERPK